MTPRSPRRFLLLALLLSVVLFPSCSGFTQCDTVATISAETARWICNSLTTVQAEAAHADTIPPARRRQLIDRSEALQEFLQDQAKISRDFSLTLSRLQEPEQAALHQERAAIIAALQRDLQVVILKLRTERPR